MTDFDAQPDHVPAVSPDPSAEDLARAEAELQRSLAGLAAIVSDAQSVDDILTHVAALALPAVTGATGTGVTLARYGVEPVEIQAWSVTAPFVREADRIQYEEVGEGPCLAAMASRRPVVCGALGSDPRWRRFGARMARLGVHSCLSLPLLVGGEVIGVLNCYAHDRDVFGVRQVRQGLRFATPAAVSVYNFAYVMSVSRDRTVQLERALTSRALIDQAIGILRSRDGGTADEAFEQLRHVSQTQGVRLALVAERIVDEAVGRARARRER